MKSFSLQKTCSFAHVLETLSEWTQGLALLRAAFSKNALELREFRSFLESKAQMGKLRVARTRGGWNRSGCDATNHSGSCTAQPPGAFPGVAGLQA